MAASRRNESSKGALPLMLLAFAIIGGFLFYLNQASKATVVEVVEAAEETPAAGEVTTVEWNTFAAAPASYQGQKVRIAGLEVVSRVGNAAFWVEAPGDTYYLVRMLPAVIDGGASPAPGAVVTVVGTGHAMADSVLDAWEAAGVITSGQRAEAEFATSFLEVESVAAR